MPWGGCTGPWWMGRKIDRAAGYINLGRRRSFCRGFRYAHQLFGPHSPEDERIYLETVARNLEEDLKYVRDQIENLRPSA